MSIRNKEIYTHLAPIYNVVMRDVDYEDWADFIDEVIQHHRPDAVSLLELACGTGQVAMHLAELDCYKITATDVSDAMLEVARRSASRKQLEIRWQQVDFLDIDLKETFDIVFVLFDSVNYLLDPADVKKLFTNVAKTMRPDSLFIFDFTTRKHSEIVADLLNDEGITNDGYHYKRQSRFLPDENIHVNEFDIKKLDENRDTVLERFSETHYQRIYELGEMSQLLYGSGFDIEAAYEDFDLIDATEKSERITIAARCRKTQ